MKKLSPPPLSLDETISTDALNTTQLDETLSQDNTLHDKSTANPALVSQELIEESLDILKDTLGASANTQTASVELQTASVELQTASVELQATSVELQTASVELQATSVELRAAPAEVESTSVELGSASAETPGASGETTNHTGPTSPRLSEETHNASSNDTPRPITDVMAELAKYPASSPPLAQERTEQLPPPDALRLGLGVQALAEATREHRIDLAQLQGAGASAPQDSLIGRDFGNFRLLKQVGHGGFGTVYKAEHIELRQPVALKVLRISQQSHPEIVERFQREARAMSRLNHRNIVRFYDFGALQDVGFYLVMEYLRGKGLDQLLSPSKLWSNNEVSHIIGQLCDALTCVHQRGLIHRDLKPANIILCPPSDEEEKGPVAKLLDFGIVGMLDGSSELTSTGSFLGTAQYVAPEQARGLDTIDARADLYSLGVILFRMLTGKLPFDAHTKVDIIVKHIHQSVPTLAESAPWKDWCMPLEHLLQRVLAKDPAERPVDAEQCKALCIEALTAQDICEREDRTVVDTSDGYASQNNLEAYIDMTKVDDPRPDKASGLSDPVTYATETLHKLRRLRNDDWRLMLLAVLATACIFGLFWYFCG